MKVLYHITTARAWLDAQQAGDYRDDSLAAEGFIHLSKAEQVVRVANQRYRGRADLVLLVVDPAQVGAEVRYEDCYQSGEQFPHLYGPLNMGAVVAVLPFAPAAGGDFERPPILGILDSPVHEFDPSPTALIEPSQRFPEQKLPERCVLTYFGEVLDSLADRLTAHPRLGSEIGPDPVYTLEIEGEPVVACQPGVGGPLAAAGMEELIARGCRVFIICGGAGALRPEGHLGQLVVPLAAVRDEGTSYHYLSPGRQVEASRGAVRALEEVLRRDRVAYQTGKTWTTDAVYRETPAMIARRREEGCLTVEMEAAAFFAVARFRGVQAAQLLYCGDDVSSDTWESRRWTRQTSVREKMFWLAVEACQEVPLTTKTNPGVSR